MRGPETSRRLGDPPPPDFVLLEPRSPYGQLTGPFYERRPAEGGLVRAFRVEERHLNSARIVHGGMLATFMDMLLAACMEQAIGRNGYTIRLVTDFVGPAKLGDWVEGRGRLVRATKSLAFLDGEVATGGGRKLMSGSAIFALA